MAEPPPNVQRADAEDRPGRGYLKPRAVLACCFWLTALCIGVAVVAAILAIWQFTGTDTLWRTVATCAVLSCGTMVFAGVNRFFGNGQ